MQFGKRLLRVNAEIKIAGRIIRHFIHAEAVVAIKKVRLVQSMFTDQRRGGDAVKRRARYRLKRTEVGPF